jgi:hypothetical protein
MKSMSFVSAVTLLMVAFIVAEFSPLSFAVDKVQDNSSKQEFKLLLKTATTPVEHRRVAEYYRREAQRLITESRSHQKMIEETQGRPLPFESKHPGAVGVSHCRYWALLDLELAQDAETQSAVHEQTADVAEQK